MAYRGETEINNINPPNENNLKPKGSAFKDFYNAFAKPGKKSYLKSRKAEKFSNERTRTYTPLKTTKADAKEILSQIEWSLV